MNKLLIQLTLLSIFFTQILSDCPNKDSKVTGLPNFEGNFPCSYSGFINLKENSDGQALFYWYFRNENAPQDFPMLIWLNGGPGASSMLGLFDESGPLQMKQGDDQKVHIYPRQNSWLEHAHLLFVDQPKGTGFSYTDGDYSGDENVVAENFIKFLEEFQNIHTETRETEWIFFGESYGGKYVPHITTSILKQDTPVINLKKIGLIDPLVYGLLQKTSTRNEMFGGLGIFDTHQMEMFDTLQRRCQEGIVEKSQETTTECKNVERYMVNQTNGINELDVRQYESKVDLVETYFNFQNREIRQQIKANLHIENTPKKPDMFGTDPEVYQAFNKTNDIYATPTLGLIKNLIQEYKMPFIIMEGVTDLLDGILGAEKYKYSIINKNDCKPRQLLKYKKSGGQCGTYGFVQECQHNDAQNAGENYQFHLSGIWNAGHLIPHDQLDASSFVLKNFINGGDFCDKECDCSIDNQQKEICENYLHNCNSNGQCVTENEDIKCKCNEGYYMADCSQKYEAIELGEQMKTIKVPNTIKNSEWVSYNLNAKKLGEGYNAFKISNQQADKYKMRAYLGSSEVTAQILSRQGRFTNYQEGNDQTFYLQKQDKQDLKLTLQFIRYGDEPVDSELSFQVEGLELNFDKQKDELFMGSPAGYISGIIVFVLGLILVTVVLIKRNKARPISQDSAYTEYLEE